MTDIYESHATGLTSPASHGSPVTPNDTTDLTQVTRAIYVGVSGSLSLTMNGGESITLTNVIAGSILPLRVARIMATGTTAQNLVSFY